MHVSGMFLLSRCKPSLSKIRDYSGLILRKNERLHVNSVQN